MQRNDMCACPGKRRQTDKNTDKERKRPHNPTAGYEELEK